MKGDAGMRSVDGKQKHIYTRPVLLSFAIPFALLGIGFLIMLLQYDAVLIGGDSSSQIMPFMAEFRRKVLSGENLLYSWTGNGGYDFWSVYCYYLSSPFTWLSVLVKEEHLHYFVSFLALLKISLCGATFAFYATRKKLCKNDAQTVLFSLIFSMCGYIAAYANYIIWLDVVALFPLLMAGMEKLVYEKKPALYTFTLAATFVCNYYLGFTVAVGVIFYYFTFRFENWRDFLNKSLRMLGFSVLSAVSSCVFLIPPFLTANEANKSGASLLQGYLGNFTESIRNLLFYDSPDTVTQTASRANIYVTLFALYFAFLWFFASDAKRNEKIKNGIILAFLFLSFNVGTLNMIWHGFRMPILVQNRFSFMFCFALICLAAKAFSQREKLNRQKAITGSIVFCIFVFALALIDPSNAVRFIGSLLAAVAYCVVFFKVKKPKIQFAFFALCATVGLYTCFILGVWNGTAHILTNVYEPALQQAIDEVQTDDSLYREKNLCLTENDADSNKQAQYGLRGFPIFSSYTAPLQTVQLVRFGLVDYIHETTELYYTEGTNSNYHKPNSFNSVTEALSGVRYVYSYTDETPQSETLQTVYEKDGITVSEVECTLPLAYMLDNETVQSLTNNDLLPPSIYNTIADSFDTKIYTYYSPTIRTSDAADLFSFSGKYTVESTDNNKEDTQITFGYKIKEDDTVLTMFFGNNQFTDVTVTCNGEMIYDKKEIYSDFPELGSFSKGDQLEVTLQGEDLMKFSFELLKTDLQALCELTEKMQTRALQITETKANCIVGTVTAQKDQSLFTTVPYSKYWTARVDGEEVAVDSLNKGFLVVPLTEGTHTVELQYTSPLFRECLFVSIGGLLLSLAVCIIYTKKQKKI